MSVFYAIVGSQNQFMREFIYGPVTDDVAMQMKTHELISVEQDPGTTLHREEIESLLVERCRLPHGFQGWEECNIWDLKNNVDLSAPEVTREHIKSLKNQHYNQRTSEDHLVFKVHIMPMPVVGDIPNDLIAQQTKKTGLLLRNHTQSDRKYYKTLMGRKGFVNLNPGWQWPKRFKYDLKLWQDNKDGNSQIATPKKGPNHIPRNLAFHRDMEQIRYALYNLITERIAKAIRYKSVGNRYGKDVVRIEIDCWHHGIKLTIQSIRDLIQLGRGLWGQKAFDRSAKLVISRASRNDYDSGHKLSIRVIPQVRERHIKEGIERPEAHLKDARFVWDLIHGKIPLNLNP